MTYILQPILKQDLLICNTLIFNNILTGFNNFHNGILCTKDDLLSLSEKETLFINFFNDLFNISNNIFTDYHVNNLNQDGLDIIRTNITNEDLKILNENLKNNNSIYFKIPNKTIMNYITKLSTRELCFCTIYTDTNPISIWGNYDFRFPIFFEKESSINYYINLATKHGLKIDNLNSPN